MPTSLRLPAVVLSSLLFVTTGFAQQPPQGGAANGREVTPNYKDAPISQIIEAVSAVTGKTFIVDPRVTGQVTMYSSTAMSPNAFYEAFLSILQVHAFVAVPSGNVIKILPDANARAVAGNDLPNTVNGNSDELVTQVIALRYANAAQLVPILRTLVAANGNLAAYTQANTLIITDHANNVARIMKILERVDRASDTDFETIQLQNATAAEVLKTLNSLTTGAPAQGAEALGQGVKVVGDDRTNSILLSGDKAQRLRIKTLIAYLDTPLESGGNTQTIYLAYADAEDLAKKLKEQIQGITQATAGTAPGGAAPAAAANANINNSVSIWGDKDTNALIVSAPPKIMDQIKAIVSKLDIRRAQVHVEAIIVEVSATKTSELGVNWAVYGSSDSNIPAALFNAGSTSISDIATAVSSSDLSSVPEGTTLGIGRIADSGTNFAMILRALQQDGNTNIISTPSIITMDNQEAKIEIAQEVPFLTGQYANTSSTSSTSSGSSTVNPFQTIQRENVGTILKITPKINQGDAVVLTIEQEASSLASKGDAVDLITNKRTISTKVLVEDGGILVLGGLMEDNLTEGETRVPILGSIPIIGNLFKTRNSSKTKTNLMVFIRPTILRDGLQATFETNSKYNSMRDLQLKRNNGKVSLQPSERQPTLPAIDSLMENKAPPPATDTTDKDGSSTQPNKEAK